MSGTVFTGCVNIQVILTLDVQVSGVSDKHHGSSSVTCVAALSQCWESWARTWPNPAKIISLVVLKFGGKVRKHHFMRLRYWVCLGKRKSQFVRRNIYEMPCLYLCVQARWWVVEKHPLSMEMINISSSCLFEKVTLKDKAKYSPEAFLQPKQVSNKSSLFLLYILYNIISRFISQTSSLQFTWNPQKQENLFLFKMVRDSLLLRSFNSVINYKMWVMTNQRKQFSIMKPALRTVIVL